MPPSERVKTIIWTKSDGRCAKCREFLCVPGSSEGVSHLIGDVAHIVGEEKDGPRGLSKLTPKQRNSEPNLLLLCKPHHKQVDDDPATYTRSVLTKIKLSHQAWVDSCRSASRVWDTELGHLDYINVPRLALLSSLRGINFDGDLTRTGSLHELGIEFFGIMSRLTGALQSAQVKAAPLELAVQQKDPTGLVISFDHLFRTKNITAPKAGESCLTRFTGNPKRDPHIYCTAKGYRVIANIDPRWVTTTTAFCRFRPSSGRSRFAGLAFVNSFDRKARSMRITPYVIGIPSNPMMEALFPPRLSS